MMAYYFAGKLSRVYQTVSRVRIERPKEASGRTAKLRRFKGLTAIFIYGFYNWTLSFEKISSYIRRALILFKDQKMAALLMNAVGKGEANYMIGYHGLLLSKGYR